MIPGYLTTAEVAERAGVSVKTVHRYLYRGNMPPADERIGRSPVWKEETITKWLEARPSASWKK